MRGDDQAVDLFVRNVGEREDGPVALMRIGSRPHLDAPHDAVGAGCRGNLEGFAPARIDLRRGGQVEGGVVTRNPHGLDSKRLPGERGEQHHRRQQDEI